MVDPAPGTRPARDGGAAPPVVGRRAELEAVESWLAAGEAAEAGSVVARTVLTLVGEAGIGKTTVWAEAVRRAGARGWRVLAARPGAADERLSFASLTDLLRDVPAGAFGKLPPPQLRPIEVATLRAEAAGGDLDPRAVGTALIALLSHLCDEQPLLLAVDDAQWLDPASAWALAFALRRAAGRRIRLLTATRLEDAAGSLERGGHSIEAALGAEMVSRIAIGPLTIAALHEILVRELGAAPRRPVLVRIHAAASGNPFYALEIAREIARLGAHDPGRPLPVPSDHRDLALLRLRRLPRATRDALARVSAMSRPSATAVDLDTLAPAERAGIVRVLADGRIDFTHPLFGSALYSSLPVATRRSLHRDLAAVETDLEERARHLALAASGPDEISAGVLDGAAEAAASRGAAEAAVELKELALSLTPPDDVDSVRRRRLELASRRYFGGDTAQARADLEQLLPDLPRGEQRAAVELELGSILWNLGEGDEGRSLMLRGLAESSDRLMQARIHSRLSAMSDDFGQALEHARAALDLLSPEDDPALYSFALHNFARTKLYSGEGADHEAIERGLRLQSQATGWELSTFPAYWARDFDDFDTARRLFGEAVQAFRESGDEASCSALLAQLAGIESMAGRLGRAREYADEALELARLTEQETWINVALTARAHVLARAGEVGAASAAARQVLDRLEAHPDLAIECMARQVLGTTAFAAGDFREVVHQLGWVDSVLQSLHLVEPAPDRIHADYAEALIAAGKLDLAEDVVRRMEARAEAVPRPWIRTVASRSRGLLLAAQGDLDGALRAIEEAVEHQRGLEMPVERARTLLALGQVRRRLNRRREARSALEEALASLDGLGVEAWAERVRAELARVPVRRAPAGLTSTEERIARLAASGMTNREMAARAFVSVKTVEANLARVYDKLGVHSRAELARAMAARDAGGNT